MQKAGLEIRSRLKKPGAGAAKNMRLLYRLKEDKKTQGNCTFVTLL